jgi:hypothetical protein
MQGVVTNVIYGITQENYDKLKIEADKIKKPAIWNGSKWERVVDNEILTLNS